MNHDINRVWLEGVVKTHPKIRSMTEKTKVTAFIVSSLETWESPDGEPRSHRNDIPVEILGKDAEDASKIIKPGDKVKIDGYLRSDQYRGRSILKVRGYNIYYEQKENALKRTRSSKANERNGSTGFNGIYGEDSESS